MLALAAAFFLQAISLEFIENETPVVIFFTLFGLIWWRGAISSRSSSTETYKEYTYRIYLQRKDGAVFWLYTFNQKSTAVENKS